MFVAFISVLAHTNACLDITGIPPFVFYSSGIVDYLQTILGLEYNIRRFEAQAAPPTPSSPLH